MAHMSSRQLHFNAEFRIKTKKSPVGTGLCACPREGSEALPYKATANELYNATLCMQLNTKHCSRGEPYVILNAQRKNLKNSKFKMINAK